jgi:hypothetical protein
MFQHFGTRLKRDLKQLVDRRLDASVLASGSVLKVGPFLSVCHSRTGRCLLVICSHLEWKWMSSHTSANGTPSGSAGPS